MKNLYIPEPCSENWESMSPQEKGRFCSVCSKCVIDFTQKSPHEIEHILTEKENEKVCGRFYNHQLNIEDGPSQKVKNQFFRFIPNVFQNSKITLAVLSLVLFLAGCSKEKEMKTGEVAVELNEDTLPNENITLGEPLKINNDTVAQMPKKDSAVVSKKHNKK
ncbi:hypothetical protein [Chryseobacterium sp. BIGb0232]|uniref:hypothetical protein n=1 Tax=Chryseobacterium sp. BIGb0232 TaxID=2940598 RepID=UPI000F47ED93|nr:hypothetical protein [Chryseobacterium sp. BIGb0232]MCS4303419.1 hypothetical protein [Chryseobacterium sp. BIGb0232]ROS11310.1 hypothetical protein EDF65_3715 [Chryseobacterium nakagawai]